MEYFALSYDVVHDYVERRAEFREEHLSLAREVHQPRLRREAHARGELVLAGALCSTTGDPVDGALLVFRAPNRGVVEAFARNDPYVMNGLVTAWRVRSWTVVIGGA